MDHLKVAHMIKWFSTSNILSEYSGRLQSFLTIWMCKFCRHKLDIRFFLELLCFQLLFLWSRYWRMLLLARLILLFWLLKLKFIPVSCFDHWKGYIQNVQNHSSEQNISFSEERAIDFREFWSWTNGPGHLAFIISHFKTILNSAAVQEIQEQRRAAVYCLWENPLSWGVGGEGMPLSV